MSHAMVTSIIVVAIKVIADLQTKLHATTSTIANKVVPNQFPNSSKDIARTISLILDVADPIQLFLSFALALTLDVLNPRINVAICPEIKTVRRIRVLAKESHLVRTHFFVGKIVEFLFAGAIYLFLATLEDAKEVSQHPWVNVPKTQPLLSLVHFMDNVLKMNTFVEETVHFPTQNYAEIWEHCVEKTLQLNAFKQLMPIV